MALVTREGRAYVAHCPALDITSQGPTIEKARTNLTEAVQSFLELASGSEVRRRKHAEPRVVSIDVELGGPDNTPRGLQAELQRSIKEARRGKVRSASEVLRDLRQRRRS